MKVKNIILLIVVLSIFTGCAQSTSETPTAAISQAPTETQIVSTPTELPAPTSTPEIPVQIGTPYPTSTDVLDKETVKSIEEFGSIQNGHLVTRPTSDFNNVFIMSRSGVSLCETSISEDLGTIVPCQTVLNHWDISPRLSEENALNTSDLVITPTGSHFMVTTDESIQVYDREGNLQGELPNPSVEFQSTLSPEGKYVALTYGGHVNISKVTDAEVVFSDDGILSQFSPDGKYLAIQKRMAVYIYTTSDWAQVYAFTQDQNSSWAISGNSNIVANFVGRELVIHNLSDGEVTQSIREFGDQKYGNGDVILSPDGKYALQVYSYPEPYEKYSYDYSDYYVSKVLDNLEYQAKITLWDLESGEIADQADTASWDVDANKSETSKIGKIYSSYDDPSYSAFRDIVTDPSNLAVDDNGSIFFLHLEKPWKGLAETQRFFNFDDGNILLYSSYTDIPNPHSNEICLLDKFSQVICQPNNSLFNILEAGLIADDAGNIYTTFQGENEKYKSMLMQTNLIPEALNTGILFSAYKSTTLNDETNIGSYQLKAVNLENRFFIGHYKYYDNVINMDTGEVLNSWKGDISNAILSPDKNYVAFIYTDPNSSKPSRLGIYDFKNNKYKLLNNEYRPSAFVFSNDSKRLLTIVNEDWYDQIISYALDTEEILSEPVVDFFGSYKFIHESEIYYTEERDVNYGPLNSITLSPNEDFILAGTENGYLFAFDSELAFNSDFAFDSDEARNLDQIVSEEYIIMGIQAYDDGSSILAVTFSNDGKTIYTSNEYGEIKVWGSQPINWE